MRWVRVRHRRRWSLGISLRLRKLKLIGLRLPARARRRRLVAGVRITPRALGRAHRRERGGHRRKARRGPGPVARAPIPMSQMGRTSLRQQSARGGERQRRRRRLPLLPSEFCVVVGASRSLSSSRSGSRTRLTDARSKTEHLFIRSDFYIFRRNETAYIDSRFSCVCKAIRVYPETRGHRRVSERMSSEMREDRGRGDLYVSSIDGPAVTSDV